MSASQRWKAGDMEVDSHGEETQVKQPQGQKDAQEQHQAERKC